MSSRPKQLRLTRIVSRKVSTYLWSVLGCLTVVFFVYIVAGPLADHLGRSSANRIADAEKRAVAQNALRQTLLTAAAGAVAVGGLTFTARTYFMVRRGQIAERYLKAVALLASLDKEEERIGGIFALEHIIRDSPDDFMTVMEVLAAFVRRGSPIQESANEPGAHHHCGTRTMRSDMQAALTVLGRQDFPERGYRINLRECDLSQADLREASFNDVDLAGSHLCRVNLRGAELRSANLIRSCLRDAYLTEAHMSDALLREADLRNANAENADLRRSDLRETEIAGFQYSGAMLKYAQLPDGMKG